MKIVQAIAILVCLIINPASSQKATGKVTKSTYQKAAVVMSYPSVEKGEGFKIFHSVEKGGKASSLFTKASKGHRELDVGSILYSQLGKSSKVSKTLRAVGTTELSLPTTNAVEYKIFGKGDKYKRRQLLSSKATSGSIGSALSVPYIKGKAGKGKNGKSSSLPPKEGLSIPSIEKEFRIFHHKHAKSGKETGAGLPSSSPSVSSVPSASPSNVPSLSSAPSDEPSAQPSESSVPTENSAKARKLKGESESKSAKASSSSSDDYRRGRVMY